MEYKFKVDPNNDKKLVKVMSIDRYYGKAFYANSDDVHNEMGYLFDDIDVCFIDDKYKNYGSKNYCTTMAEFKDMFRDNDDYNFYYISATCINGEHCVKFMKNINPYVVGFIRLDKSYDCMGRANSMAHHFELLLNNEVVVWEVYDRLDNTNVHTEVVVNDKLLYLAQEIEIRRLYGVDMKLVDLEGDKYGNN